MGGLVLVKVFFFFGLGEMLFFSRGFGIVIVVGRGVGLFVFGG